MTVTVAIPVRNGGSLLEQVLQAVRAQQVDSEVEILVCDSGSTDGSVALSRGYGAHVLEIPAREFSHGGTRNLLMQEAAGEHVALLTQDAVPGDERWLARLLSGFRLAENVGLVFGPYRPRSDASPMVARELADWFAVFSTPGEPRIDRLRPDERDVEARQLFGPRGFFTDANGCISKAAWRIAPFRPVAYAEDHVLAHDMLRAGFAKVYLPDAPVIHSHDYSAVGWLRRSFDEARALKEIYGFVEHGDVRRSLLLVWGLVGADLRWGRRTDQEMGPARLAARSLALRASRAAGTMLGTRADRMPQSVVRWLSLERRATAATQGPHAPLPEPAIDR